MKDRLIALVYLLALIACCCFISAALSKSHSKQRLYYSPTWVESYTVGNFDRLQIRKIYQLELDDDPSFIPTEDFAANGRTYRLFDMTWEESDGRVLYTAIFNEIESY